MEFETENWGQKLLCDEGRPVDGDIVKPGVGATVGRALGSALGSADGRAVVGSNVGTELGAAVFPAVGLTVGILEGDKVLTTEGTADGVRVGDIVT